jgi:hypothetical protein
VDVKSWCWVVIGGWTWSNVNTCFLPEDTEEAGVAAALEPTDEGAEDVASTATLVEEMALMTVL